MDQNPPIHVVTPQVNKFTLPPKNSPVKAKTQRKVSKDFLLVGIIALLVGALGFLGFKYYELTAPARGDVLGAQESRDVTENIKQLVSLDNDEDLNIVRVEDPEQFRKQNPSFYRDVQAGQYVIVLGTSQRVLIYDKSQHKLINFSSYTVTPELIDESKFTDAEKPLKIELRVAANVTPELSAKFSADIAKLSKNYRITATTVAAKSDYKGVTLVLLNKKDKPQISQNLQNQITSAPGKKSVVESMPAGEATSTADAVIILGIN